MDFKDILAMKKPVTKAIPIQMNGALADEIERLTDQILAAKRDDRLSNLSDVAPGLTKQLRELTESAKDTLVWFTFKSIGRPKWDALMSAHKPTPQQRKEFGKTIAFDPDTFPAMAVAASCVDPTIEVDEAKEIFDSEDWNDGELTKLYMAAQEVNTEVPDVPLSSPATALISTSAQSLITPADTESLIVDSLEGLEK